MDRITHLASSSMTLGDDINASYFSMTLGDNINASYFSSSSSPDLGTLSDTFPSSTKETFLLDKIKRLERENAELEMKSILTFGKVSSLEFGQEMLKSRDETRAAVNSLINMTCILSFAKENPIKEGEKDEIIKVLAMENQALKEKVATLTYVSRLWSDYVHNLTLLQRENRDLKSELDQYRKEEKAEKLKRVFAFPSTLDFD